MISATIKHHDLESFRVITDFSKHDAHNFIQYYDHFTALVALVALVALLILKIKFLLEIADYI